MSSKEASQPTGLASRVLALSTQGTDMSSSLELLQSPMAVRSVGGRTANGGYASYGGCVAGDEMEEGLLKNIEHAHPDMCLAAISVFMEVAPASVAMTTANMERVEYLMGMAPDVDDAQKCALFRYLQHCPLASEEDALLILLCSRFRGHPSVPPLQRIVAGGEGGCAGACEAAHDPDYLVQAKLACIQLGADAANAIDITEELSGWIGETTAQHDQAVIAAIGRVGMLNRDTAAKCSGKLIEMLETVNSSSSPTQPALVAMRRAMLHAMESRWSAKMASAYADVFASLARLDIVSLARACSSCDASSIALLHLIAADQMASLPIAPYVLEFYIRDYESLSTSLKLALLGAAQAVFGSQPAVAQSFYVQLLRHATASEEPVLLRDRACFQLRLMNAARGPLNHADEPAAWTETV
ncbi:hypothetical protein SYNPS1DRAFT_26667 [Syncephalis pseudoplumigaleata]|uniref:Uncharacterized protein n=1 Tax=Syncephalis pseudoplumigaleata TaxID=1712513 RepID=A0A4V1J287_9FUNG|nr:hypothetical protein SYNPS1DRAFT_26667 [Syncephalis pseudoplumigaleata]|eukprot:RKP27699.1 hypothetical protein SYNPS1DRAFT_26667 [Syncephalis pseudoplumigaleata]